MKAVSVQSLSFKYDSLTIFNNISFEIEQGSFTAILGRNGSGKSTLLRIMAYLLPYHSGKITILEKHELSLLSAKQRASLIGFLPQFHKPVFPFTVADVVMTGRARFIGFSPSSEDQNAIVASLERVGMSEYISRPYNELSGGEQQLVLIARLLAQNPKILLLDEPVSHLDIKNQIKIFKLIRSFTNDGMTVCAVLHDPNSALLYADNFLFLQRNHSTLTTTVYYNPPNINESFLKEIFDTDLNIINYKNFSIVVPRDI